MNFSWHDAWTWFIGPPLRIAAIVVSAIVVQALSRIVIRRLVNRSIARQHINVDRRAAATNGEADLLLEQRHSQRANAVGSLLLSAAIITIWVIAIAMILEVLRIDIGPLLASAGIVGIAIGFGAQALIKDYFSGIALILEDQFGVGDVVELNGVQGTVEEVTLRITRIRDRAGVVWYVRNGEILKVANMSQGWSTASVIVPVAADVNLSDVQRVLNAMGDELFHDRERGAALVSAPRYEGVELLTADVSRVRVQARTEPGQDLVGGRVILEAARKALTDAGIALAGTEESGAM